MLDMLGERITVLERELETIRRLRRDRQDAALIRAIAHAAGYGTVFTATDIRDAARLHHDLACALEGLTQNTLGRRLMRVCNRPVGDCVVHLIERSNRGRVYAIAPRHRAAGGDASTGA